MKASIDIFVCNGMYISCVKSVFFSILFLATQISAEVVDVDGDGVVGPHEVLEVAEQWKGEAKAADAHDHLGQTWVGVQNPLKLRGNFSPRFIIRPVKMGAKGGGYCVPKNLLPSGFI